MSNKEKKEKKPMKKWKKIVLGIVLSIIGLIVLFLIVVAIISQIGIRANLNKIKSFPDAGCQQLELDNYDNGCWDIESDNGLKVLQLTDVHLGGGFLSIQKDSMAINTIASLITTEKPDLVIVTGDIAYPVPHQAGTLNNKSGAKMFAQLMEQLGVYWTLAYGNHDTEVYSYFSREQITEFYSSGKYPHCLLQNGPQDVDGSGNQVLNIVNSDGVITRSMILIDSHAYVDGDYFGINWKYDNIHENQIAWYSQTVSSLNTRNALTISSLPDSVRSQYASLPSIVPSSVFFHIPMSEYREAWNEYVNNGYQDTENVKYKYGVAGETGVVVYCGVYPDNMFETMLEDKSTDSVFCGHDHLNNFSVNYKGIYLTYGMSIDYLAYSGIYKLGAQRGCTVINYDKNGSIDFHQENYYQSKYLSQYAKEAVTMQEVTTVSSSAAQ